MIYPSIDKLTNKIGSKFLLVNIISERSREMSEYKHYQMEEKEYKAKKDIGKALEEVANDLMKVKESK